MVEDGDLTLLVCFVAPEYGGQLYSAGSVERSKYTMHDRRKMFLA